MGFICVFVRRERLQKSLVTNFLALYARRDSRLFYNRYFLQYCYKTKRKKRANIFPFISASFVRIFTQKLHDEKFFNSNKHSTIKQLPLNWKRRRIKFYASFCVSVGTISHCILSFSHWKKLHLFFGVSIISRNLFIPS